MYQVWRMIIKCLLSGIVKRVTYDYYINAQDLLMMYVQPSVNCVYQSSICSSRQLFNLF